MTEEKQSGNKTNKVLVVLCILLGLGCIFFALNTFVPGFQPVKSVEYVKLEDQKDELNVEYQKVQASLENSKTQIEGLKGQNAELDKLIAERQAEVDNLNSQIQTLMKNKNKTDSDRARLQELIKKLQEENTAYIAQIQQLAEEKKVLQEENKKLTTDLTVEKESNKKLSESNNYLSGKFEMGKLLQTQNIFATGVKTKSNGKEIETNKVNRLDKIRVCFETGDNKVLDPGPVDLYLRLISPQGVTIVVESMGSGILKNSAGEDVQYTKSIQFDFNSKSKKICIYWSQNVYTEGTYKAEVYQSGYKIGETSFQLD